MKNLTNPDLVKTLKELVGEERKMTALILDHLAVAQDRKLYLDYGYSNLHEFCVEYLGYTSGSAHRRISAMWLMKSVPEVREKLVTGDLSLTVAAQTQTFFFGQAKASKPVPRAKKVELLKAMEKKSVKACERMLLELDPETVKPDKARAVTDELTELRLTVDQGFMRDLQDLKNLYSHSQPCISNQEVFRLAMKELLLKKDPARGRSKSKSQAKAKSDASEVSVAPASDQPSHDASAPSAGRVFVNCENSRRVPPTLARAVWLKSESKCCFVSPITGQRCGSQRFLECDHVIPFSKGGKTVLENLQLLCDQHNRQKSNHVAH